MNRQALLALVQDAVDRGLGKALSGEGYGGFPLIELRNVDLDLRDRDLAAIRLDLSVLVISALVESNVIKIDRPTGNVVTDHEHMPDLRAGFEEGRVGGVTPEQLRARAKRQQELPGMED